MGVRTSSVMRQNEWRYNNKTVLKKLENFEQYLRIRSAIFPKFCPDKTAVRMFLYETIKLKGFFTTIPSVNCLKK